MLQAQEESSDDPVRWLVSQQLEHRQDLELFLLQTKTEAAKVRGSVLWLSEY